MPLYGISRPHYKALTWTPLLAVLVFVLLTSIVIFLTFWAWKKNIETGKVTCGNVGDSFPLAWCAAAAVIPLIMTCMTWRGEEYVLEQRRRSSES